MIARLARADDLPALAEIWNVSFPGDEAFSNWFFRSVFEPANALVWEDGTRPAGMLHLLPMRCQIAGQAMQAAYIYAVAVRPECRGRGVAAALLAEALQLARARGASLAMLVPQSPSLFEYYRRQGFKTGLLRSKRAIAIGQHGAAPGLTLDDSPDVLELNDFFNTALAARDYVARTPEHWAQSLSYLRALAVRKDGRVYGYAIYDPEASTVRELVAVEEEARAALEFAVLGRLDRSETVVFGPDGPGKPYGMVLTLIPGIDVQDCYASLMLD